MNPREKIILVDNGSLEPASTQQLRRLATELAARVGAEVVPASIAHSAKVPAALLDDRPAELFDGALDRVLGTGATEISVVPLFVGPSYAIVRHVPAVIAERRKSFPAVRIGLAEPLFIPGERRLAQILTENVRAVAEEWNGACASPPGRRAPPPTMRLRVAIVDHGSPSRGVTEVRDAVAARVGEFLRNEVEAVAACSMERREGPEYAFNEPLLETLLQQDGWRDGSVIVALLFIAPGRHAGPDGDVAQIVKRVRPDGGAGVKFTPVMGAHPLLLQVLADRVREVHRF